VREVNCITNRNVRLALLRILPVDGSNVFAIGRVKWCRLVYVFRTSVLTVLTGSTGWMCAVVLMPRPLCLRYFLGRGHTQETGCRNFRNITWILRFVTMVYNTQNYWIFREVLSAWAEHMLHDTEYGNCGCQFPWCARRLTCNDEYARELIWMLWRKVECLASAATISRPS
jgi:hypothetical protein